MNVRLVVERGARGRQEWPIQPPGGSVGRAKGNTIRIPSAEVSRRHCRLLLTNDLVTVEDLGSVNGTLLNGRLVQGIEVVRPGDRLAIGPVTFVVQYELTAKARNRLGEDGSDEYLDVVPVEEDVPTFALDDLAVIEDQPEEVLPAEEPESIKPDFTFDEAWQPPQGDLRDLLAQMEQEPDTGEDEPKRKKT